MNQLQPKINETNPVVLSILFMVASTHLLNDLIQSMLMATYPLLESKFQLNFAQIGSITLVYQITASILQPWIGLYTDKHPKPYLLPIGMSFTTCGILLLALANHFYLILLAATLQGIGSSVFHPEASRVARNASGGRFGFAQSVFQVGGNTGSFLGPLLVSLLVLRYNNQANILYFVMLGIFAVFLLSKVSHWSAKHLAIAKRKPPVSQKLPYSKSITTIALIILGILIFSKYFYMASMSNYYAFYLMEKFKLPTYTATLFSSLFLASVALGTFIGGPIGDRIGRKYVIWASILGAAPFTLILPHLNSLALTGLFSAIIGIIISSAFSAIVVYAQELVPGRVGMIAGIFFGLMFGIGGIAAAVLGKVADMTSLTFIFNVCAFFPLMGILTIFLPNVDKVDK